MKPRLLIALLALAVGQACLVLSVNPAYDADTLTWEPGLIGNWQNIDDNSSMAIERDEWHSYRIQYVHPIEKGDLTGYLTAIGDSRYLDVMPVRGQDRGAFLIPVHAVVRITLDGDRLELTPLAYDWFFDRLKSRVPVGSLQVILDQKENALIGSSTTTLRNWIRRQPASGRMFGATAVFMRRAAPAKSLLSRDGGDHAEHVVQRDPVSRFEMRRHRLRSYPRETHLPLGIVRIDEIDVE